MMNHKYIQAKFIELIRLNIEINVLEKAIQHWSNCKGFENFCFQKIARIIAFLARVEKKILLRAIKKNDVKFLPYYESLY